MKTEVGVAARELTTSWWPDLPHGERWTKVIRRSQEVEHLVYYAASCGLVTAPRVRFGAEERDWGPVCGDCGVAEGQFHVPGCDIERCPRCGAQLITCGPRQGCVLGREAGFLVPELGP